MLSMAKEEWGTKRVCPTTGKRFYDLNRDPVVSPYTGEVVPLETGKSNRTMLADKADKNSEKKDQTEEEDVVLDDDNSGNDNDLGDDVLEDDEDDDNVSLDDIADVSDENSDD